VIGLLLAETPALPLDEAGKYVAGAYVVFLVLIVIYVAIMASKLQRMEKELRELAGFAESRAQGEEAAPGRGSEGQSISDSLALAGADEAAPDE
jgi:flagellar biosynthesis/type III secretory pathway M-ring protein FliF/YscJ